MNKTLSKISNQIILACLKQKPKKREQFLRVSNKILGENKSKVSPTNFELLHEYYKLIKDKKHSRDIDLEKLLRVKKTRSLSGVVVVSVLTKPYACPGKCIYCPSQKGMPKSYLKNEPAVMRAVLNHFDPYRQVQNRLRALKYSGHPVDKINLRIVGGTWSYYPKNYQTWFIKKLFQAANEFEDIKLKKIDLLSLQQQNQKAKIRIVQISVETRPDFINIEEIKRMRKFGITKVELGVQTLKNDILDKNCRGHKIESVQIATQLLRDAGMKVSYQMMLNLPGSNTKIDFAVFQELFSNPAYRPDYIKIYPLAIVKEAQVYKLYKSGKFKPYSKKQLISLIAKIKEILPYYTRVERVIRDIPSQEIVAGGAQLSNMREYIQEYMKKQNSKCKCIRCREIKDNSEEKDKLMLFRQDYQTAGGTEIFLSFENKSRTKLYSMVKLRVPKKPKLKVLNESGIIREIRTFGQELSLDKNVRNTAVQHKGFGKKILAEAEKIIFNEFKMKKIAVISGIGVRNYFIKQGYVLENTYMVKKSFKKVI